MFGKNILVYSSSANRKYSPIDLSAELPRFLGKFQLNKALGLISEISSKIFRNRSYIYLKGVPVSDSILAYIALKLIENSNDHRSGEMTPSELAKACDMYWGLPDPCYTDNNVEASLIRLGMQQFDFDREKRNSLARTLIIYKKLWSKIDTNNIDIQKSIQGISGLALEEALLLSYFFMIAPNEKYFELYNNINKSKNNLSKVLEVKKQEAFISWIGCRYSNFRDELKSQNIPEPQQEYEKYRFNPLINYPIIIPDKNVIQGGAKTYIVPIKILLYERVTKKLYFDLTKHFSPSKGNKFRTVFGKVFEEYIGVLLKETIDYAEILGEWEYANSSLNKRTPDWIILKDEKAILIEVKQSCLYREAKNWGDLEEVKAALPNTIGKAVKQLWRFEQDLETGKYEKLGRLSEIKYFERLIVTYDRSYFSNSILKDLIHEINPDVPQNYYWHLISVEEFEPILGIPKSNLFEILESKRIDQEGSIMDFRSYTARKYSGSSINLKFLDDVDENFFAEFEIFKRA